MRRHKRRTHMRTHRGAEDVEVKANEIDFIPMGLTNGHSYSAGEPLRVTGAVGELEMTHDHEISFSEIAKRLRAAHLHQQSQSIATQSSIGL